jgi:hypothetical protein
LKKGCRRRSHQALVHHHAVVESGVFEHLKLAPHSASAGFSRGEYEPGYPGVKKGAGTHGAGL